MLTTKLSTQNHFLYHNGTPFILSNSIEKDIDKLVFKIEIKQLHVKDEIILKQIAESCRKDNNSSTLISKVSGIVLFSYSMNRDEAENLLFTLIPMMTVEKIPYTSTEKYTIELVPEPNRLVFPFTAIGLWRFFKALRSFVDNYLVLLASFNSDIEKKYKETQDKKEEQIQQEINKINNDGAEIKKDESVKSKNKTIASFCDFCCNQQVKILLFELIFNYYAYIPDNIFKYKEKDGKKYFLIPNLFPDALLYDKNYIKEILETVTCAKIASIYLVYKKLMNFLITKDLSKIPPLYILATLFLLTIYSYAFIKEKDAGWIESSIFDEYLKNSKIQANIINYFMNEISHKETGKDFNFILCGNNEYTVNDHYSDNEYINKIIQDFSKEYEHLISVSKDKFLELVFNKVEEKTRSKNEVIDNKFVLIKDFVLSNQKVIDIDSIFKLQNRSINEMRLSSVTPLITPLINNNFDFEISKVYRLLNYNLNNPYFSELYFYINKYIETPSIISKLKSDKILPLEVINLFNYFSTTLFKTDILRKEISSTLDYYKIILDTINSPENFKHSTILYIIFQGIIPYYMKTYNKRIFTDYLL